ncbi:MAG TPA: nucleoside deaminase [bacterium]|nr:nucleoside deaminase [bacterium]
MAKSILPEFVDETFMLEAIKEANKAALIGEVPVGAVIVYKGKIFARAHNKRIKKNSAIAHAEIEVIQKATKKLGDWRLKDMSLYVTVEPCIMCVGAIIHSRIEKLVYGCDEPKMGAINSVMKVFDNKKHHHKPLVYGGVLKQKCSNILKTFFKKLRS